MHTSCSQGVLHQSHRSAYRFRFFSFGIRRSESQSHRGWKTTRWMGVSGVWSEIGRGQKRDPETGGVWMCLRVLSRESRSILYIPWNDTTVGELGAVYQYWPTDGSRSQIVRLMFFPAWSTKLDVLSPIITCFFFFTRSYRRCPYLTDHHRICTNKLDDALRTRKK